MIASVVVPLDVIGGDPVRHDGRWVAQVALAGVHAGTKEIPLYSMLRTLWTRLLSNEETEYIALATLI